MAKAKDIELSVRSYWLTGQASVGALLRFGNISLVVADTRNWKTKDGAPYGKEIFAMSRLQGILGEQRTLRRPWVEERQQHASGYTAASQQLPVVRFPGWLHCSSCHHLSFLPWRGQGKPLEEVRCQNCPTAPRLKPAPWVIAGTSGFLADFLWHEFLHRSGEKGPVNRCERREQLYLFRQEKTGKEMLQCKACGAARTLDEVDKRDFGKWVTFQPWQPWDHERKHHEVVADGDFVRAMRLTDLRLHVASTTSAVDIPPESRLDHNDLRLRMLRHRDYDKWRGMRFSRQVMDHLRKVSRRWHVPFAEMQAAWNDLQEGWPENLPGVRIPESVAELRAQEYAAFSTDWGDMGEEERFIVRDLSTAWRQHVEDLRDDDAALVEKVVAVDRLREVLAFQGFLRPVGPEPKRVLPDGRRPQESRGESAMIDTEEDWTPAVELHGEGIFFTLAEPALQAWEELPAVADRADTIRRRFATDPPYALTQVLCIPDNEEPSRFITPRLLLLHSLAHLMIRQLEFMAGVPAASIRERIYCSDDEGVGRMAGLLLYTTSADQAGSLAGLSVLAEPQSFHRLLRAAVEHGAWCSFDPVCAEHEGSGPKALNRAACHGCCLLPEPSCELQNSLLDRTFVVGGAGTAGENGKIGFFGRG